MNDKEKATTAVAEKIDDNFQDYLELMYEITDRFIELVQNLRGDDTPNAYDAFCIVCGVWRLTDELIEYVIDTEDCDEEE